MSKINYKDLSPEEKAELLEELKAEQEKDRKRKLKAKEAYVGQRDSLVRDLVKEARQINSRMAEFKSRAVRFMEEFRETAKEYGDIRSSSKGGFSLRHSADQTMVSLDRNTIPEYDERAAMAETLLKEFLEETVKKRDQPTYKLVQTLLARNKAGDFTPSRVAALLAIKDNYTDERWTKAMQLLEESYTIRDVAYGLSFYEKDGMGKDQAIKLTFASIPVELKPEDYEQDVESD